MIEDELFAGRPWAEVLERAYGFTVEWTAAGFPFAPLDDLAGRRVSSLPFSDYLPFCTVGSVEDHLSDLRRQYPGRAITIKATLPEDATPTGMEITRRAVYHRYQTGGASSSEFRRGVRKAVKQGVRIARRTDADGLDRFLELYHWQRLNKFGGIPQPPSFFRAIFDVFIANDKGFFLEALTAENELAASVVVLSEGTGWFYKFGASDPDHLSTRPNNLIFQHLIEAVDAGEATFLDFGLSGAGDSYAGLRRFKSGTGATEHPVTYFRSPGAVDERADEFLKFVYEFTKATAASGNDRAAIAPISERLYRYLA
ncbi:GNAT family N-acetyltransferase [Neolewinella antarctica]|uniref:BioF2-like acetyltransferase domain-containing protein n=1 Tax=Neolewinella antarctica TaxID=442734 RepID=A0ABX0XA82_9BACT|nr:GNAT family N-acetyltransferase [Neolewinella antarctica]NJC26140.1 hypothetical protein [Neolewinella antarctica]